MRATLLNQAQCSSNRTTLLCKLTTAGRPRYKQQPYIIPLPHPHNTLCTHNYSQILTTIYIPGAGNFPLLDTVGGLGGLTMGSL